MGRKAAPRLTPGRPVPSPCNGCQYLEGRAVTFFDAFRRSELVGLAVEDVVPSTTGSLRESLSFTGPSMDSRTEFTGTAGRRVSTRNDGVGDVQRLGQVPEDAVDARQLDFVTRESFLGEEAVSRHI